MSNSKRTQSTRYRARRHHAASAAGVAQRVGSRQNRRAQNTRQLRPNVADLPRSASQAALDAALRMRATQASGTTRPVSRQPSATPSRSQKPSAARNFNATLGAASQRAGAWRDSAIAGVTSTTNRATNAMRRTFASAGEATSASLSAGAKAVQRAIPQRAPRVPTPARHQSTLPLPQQQTAMLSASTQAVPWPLAQPAATTNAIAPQPTAMAAQALTSAAAVDPILPTGQEMGQAARSTVARVKQHAGSRLVITAALLVAILLALIPTPMLAYNNTMGLAKDGQTQLKLAENDFKSLATSPTNIALINDAQMHLQNAHNDFFQLQVRIDALAPFSGLPQLHGKLDGAAKLIPIAVEGTQAGILACDALKTLIVGLKNPLGTTGGLTSDNLTQIASDMDQVQTLYNQMLPQVMGLTQADLSLAPSLWPTIVSVRAKLPEITPLLNDVVGVAHALPGLLGVGSPSSYLVEVLDSSELRPTGGFIGNFGVLTLNNGRLAPFHISDITLIDSSNKFDNAPYKFFVPIPKKYNWLRGVFTDPNSASWSLRDSNLDPNYPTAAQYALQLYPVLLPFAQKNLEAQGSSLQLYDPAKSGQFVGVVTLSLGFFANALNVTGPLDINDGAIHERVTSQNFVSLIHSYALGTNSTGPDNKACGVTSCSKVFTSDVVKAFMDKVKSNLPIYVGKLGKLTYDSLKTKDVEVYLTQSDAEKALQDLHIAGTVAAPATGDSLFEVDANIGANKDNAFLKYAMSDQITLGSSGSATHHLAWSYQWPNDPATLKQTFAAGGPDYFSYSRVYTPPSATLISQRNLSGFGSNTEFGRNVYYGNVTDGYAQTSKYALAWSVPNAVTKDSSGYHYHLIVQREAGIVWPLTLKIALPAGAIQGHTPTISGLSSQDTVVTTGDTLTITGPLTGDLQVQIDYTLPAASLPGSAG